MKVKVGLAQFSPQLGDVPSNLSSHLNIVAEAVAQGVDLLVFPELSLAGYDRYGMIEVLEILKKASHGVNTPIIMRSHPYLDDRIDAVKKEISTRKTY